MIRADMLLVQRGLAASRTLAQRLIAAGRVLAGEPAAPVRKPSEQLAADATLQVLPGDAERFVSRGGLKLAAALAHCGVDVRGLACLDVGQSTGGFTDCLLQAGAGRVVGVDVGHDQLHPRIAADPRVVAI
jgi:23S rRNA (cytidine1920-2'-O)/16S rRNA (cytidine1409-2'-O)-methyltransferase